MSKFTIGSKIRLKPSAENWSFGFYTRTWEYPNEPLSLGESSVGSYVELYPNDFELVEENKERHIHYDMIVEWATKPSRVVQWRDNEDCSWQNCSEDKQHPFPVWDEDLQYRFKPERVFPTTSLTEKELGNIFLAAGGWNILDDGLTAIANASIKKHILDEENK